MLQVVYSSVNVLGSNKSLETPVISAPLHCIVSYLQYKMYLLCSCSGPSTTTETETVAKYEIMDGAPVKGESIPIRLFLAGTLFSLLKKKIEIGIFFKCDSMSHLLFLQDMTWHPPWGMSTRSSLYATSLIWCWWMKRTEDTLNNR